MVDKDTENVEQAAPPSMLKKLVLPVVLVVVAVGATIGGLKFSGLLGAAAPAAQIQAAESAAPVQAGEPAYFFSLYPDLLVNFKADGRPHFLKVSVDVMSRDENAIQGVEEYHAIVRNNLLTLFQQVEYETVNSQEGIDTMRALALEEIKKILANYHGNDDVEGVYFTSFVVQ